MPRPRLTFVDSFGRVPGVGSWMPDCCPRLMKGSDKGQRGRIEAHRESHRPRSLLIYFIGMAGAIEIRLRVERSEGTEFLLAEYVRRQEAQRLRLAELASAVKGSVYSGDDLEESLAFAGRELIGASGGLVGA